MLSGPALSRTEYRTDVVIKQTPPVNLPLEIDATDRSARSIPGKNFSAP
jgi:hypothetical protein